MFATTFFEEFVFYVDFLLRTLITETRDLQSTWSLYRMVPIYAIGNRENLNSKFTFQDLPIWFQKRTNHFCNTFSSCEYTVNPQIKNNRNMPLYTLF